MVLNSGPFAGMVSPELCWSAHKNELRVHSTMHLEPHAGHGTTGLPQQALFRFTVPQVSRRSRSPSARSADGQNAADIPGPTGTNGPMSRPSGGTTAARKLLVRDVVAFELRDGRSVLLCLVSSYGVPSEIHCVEPRTGKTLGVATGLPIMLTSLAVLPMATMTSTSNNSTSSTGNTDKNSSALAADRSVRGRGNKGETSGELVAVGTNGRDGSGNRGGEADDVVVAVGGLGGQVRLVGMQLSTKDQHPRNSTQRGGMRGRAAPAQQVQNHQYQHDQNLLRQLARSPAAGNGGVPAEREGVPITSLSAFFVPGGAGAETTGGRVMVAAGWEDGHWAATPCFVADTGGAGCVPSRGVGNGRGRGVTGPGEVRGDTGALASGAVLHIVHQPQPRRSRVRSQHPGAVAAAAAATFLLWVNTSKGFMLYEVPKLSSAVQSLHPCCFDKRRLVQDAPPQCLRAMAVGGGRPHELMSFASFRASDNTPVLIVVDTEKSAGAAAASGTPTVNVVEEIELSTRCCGNSVIAARPHVVWVNPAGVKVFASGGLGGEGDGGSVGGGGDDMVVPGRSLGQRVHLKMTITIAEASLSETGRARVRAWEHFHLGHAHRVGEKLDQLGCLAFCNPSQEPFMDTDTARNITAVGKDSLHHIIGGNPPHLWHKGSLHAPPPTTKNNNNPDSDEHPKESVEDCSGAVGIEGPRSVVGDDDSEASLLLDARLQGGVLLGRAPAIARILTATVPGGGEWVLPRAGPVQDWAAAVAFGSWEEARRLLTPNEGDLRTLTGDALTAAVAELDSLARRARQVERILQGSVDRCDQYCRAAADATAANRALFRRSVSTQQYAARVAATVPLRARLQRAIAAGELTYRLTSAASFILAGGAGVRDDGGRNATETQQEIAAPARETSMAPPTAITATTTTTTTTTTTIGRLRELAGLAAEDGEDCLCRLAKLAELAAALFNTGDGRSLERLETGTSEKKKEREPALDLLDLGLATVAYSVMSFAVARNSKPLLIHPAVGGTEKEDGSKTERAALDRADRGLERFSNQVNLGNETRLRARLSWLLDHRDVVEGALPAAASALLCPRAVASVRADRELLLIAAAALAGGTIASNSDGGMKRSVFAPLAKELLRAAGHPVLDFASLATCGEGGEENPGAGHSLHIAKRPRNAISPVSPRMPLTPLEQRHDQREEKPEMRWQQSPCGSTPTSSGDGATAAEKRERGCTAWETPRGVRPTPGAAADVSASGKGNCSENDPGSSAGVEYGRRRQRGQTVWETPRGVGLTPRTSSKTRKDADDSGTGDGEREAGVDARRRERGQTVWQTPRGVGLTPRASATEEQPSSAGRRLEETVAGEHDEGLMIDNARRERGQTVWQTPRGVGLTPRWNNEEHQERRSRGNTVWETPRGVGLTPKTSSVSSRSKAGESDATQSDVDRGTSSSHDMTIKEMDSELETRVDRSHSGMGESSCQSGLRSFAEGH